MRLGLGLGFGSVGVRFGLQVRRKEKRKGDALVGAFVGALVGAFLRAFVGTFVCALVGAFGLGSGS